MTLKSSLPSWIDLFVKPSIYLRSDPREHLYWSLYEIESHVQMLELDLWVNLFP
jgi:hypothetical protein